ncbi:MAG: hypothetical protein Rhims3KO_12510 [Hyphomicrobiales bacterium]
MAYYLKLVFQPHAGRHFDFEGEVTNAGAFGLSAGEPIYWPMPEKARALTRYKSMPDVFPLPGVNGVNGRFRDLVEEFEPGLHEFFPLTLVWEDGSPIEGDWFIFNCTVSVDTLFPEKSGAEWSLTVNGRPYNSLRPNRDWVLSRPAIGGRHLWCGKRIQHGGGVYCSDVFYEELKRRKIKFIAAKHCAEIDEPWVAEDNVDRQLAWEKTYLKNIDVDSSIREINNAARQYYSEKNRSE